MSVLFWVRGVIRFMALMLTWCWSVVLRILRCASRVSEGVGGVRVGDGPVRVYSLYGLGFGSDVTVVVRLGEGLD